MGRGASAAKKRRFGKNGNLGSKERNIANKTAIKKQLANPNIPEYAKDLIRRSPVYHPFPLGDGYIRKSIWEEHMRDSISQARAARDGRIDTYDRNSRTRG